MTKGTQKQTLKINKAILACLKNVQEHLKHEHLLECAESVKKCAEPMKLYLIHG